MGTHEQHGHPADCNYCMNSDPSRHNYAPRQGESRQYSFDQGLNSHSLEAYAAKVKVAKEGAGRDLEAYAAKVRAANRRSAQG